MTLACASGGLDARPIAAVRQGVAQTVQTA